METNLEQNNLAMQESLWSYGTSRETRCHTEPSVWFMWAHNGGDSTLEQDERRGERRDERKSLAETVPALGGFIAIGLMIYLVIKVIVRLYV